MRAPAERCAPPLDDNVRLSAAAYREFVATRLAEQLSEPQHHHAPLGDGDDGMGA